MISSEPGTRPDPRAEAGVDVARGRTTRRAPASWRRSDVEGADDDALVLIDATSGAAACRSTSARPTSTTSPAVLRVRRRPLAGAVLPGRPRARRGDHGIRPLGPDFFSLPTAISNSRLDQTYNTPAVATLAMLANQVEWLNDQGGLDWATARTKDSSGRLYDWAEASDYATPYVTDPAHRSQVVATIDVDDAIDATAIAKVLRAHGVVDVEPYRKLGRNQLRVACFPAVEPDDVSKAHRLRRARRRPALLTQRPEPCLCRPLLAPPVLLDVASDAGCRVRRMP